MIKKKKKIVINNKDFILFYDYIFEHIINIHTQDVPYNVQIYFN